MILDRETSLILISVRITFFFSIFVGEFQFGSHGRCVFDGFTIILKIENINIQYLQNLFIQCSFGQMDDRWEFHCGLNEWY